MKLGRGSKTRMGEQDAKQAVGSQPSPAEAAPPVVPAPPPAPVAPPPETDELAALRREVAELRDKNLRLLADAQNLHKRTQREKDEALRYAEGDFARELLVVLDDLERTRASAQADADAQALAEGVRIVYEHFLKILQDRGISPIEAVGRPFNPDFHEALLQRPHPTHPAGTVIEEAARGWRMRERVLRPSRVIVSAGADAGRASDGKQPDQTQRKD